jgi:hypothetical protein
MEYSPKKSDLTTFAFIWALILFVVGIYPWFAGGSLSSWALLLGLICILLRSIRPSLLLYPFLVWMKFGELTGKVISTCVLAIIFFLLITPTGFVFMMMRSDLLSKKVKKDSKSYFFQRDCQPRSMRNQF